MLEFLFSKPLRVQIKIRRFESVKLQIVTVRPVPSKRSHQVT